MRDRIHGNEYWVTLVYVDSYENGELKGRFSNPYLEMPEQFTSLSDFLVKIECLLDTMRLPQSYAEPRTFKDMAVSIQNGSQVRLMPGRKATFALSVRFRQHNSWQGYVTWLDKNQRQNFRSALELVFLLDSALREDAVPSGETISLS